LEARLLVLRAGRMEPDTPVIRERLVRDPLPFSTSKSWLGYTRADINFFIQKILYSKMQIPS
jgi:hypothetical protein